MTAASRAGQDTTLREEIARWLMYRDEVDWESQDEEVRDFYRSEADEFLGEPAVRRLLDAEARAQAAEAKVAAVEARPCPTCAREGGPYRCCPHCADDPIAHEDGQRNHHDLPCQLCVLRRALDGDA